MDGNNQSPRMRRCQVSEQWKVIDGWNEDETYVTTTLDLRVARPRGGAVVRRDGVAGGGTGGGRVGRGSALLMRVEVAGSEMMEVACEGLEGDRVYGQHSMAVEDL